MQGPKNWTTQAAEQKEFTIHSWRKHPHPLVSPGVNTKAQGNVFEAACSRTCSLLTLSKEAFLNAVRISFQHSILKDFADQSNTSIFLLLWMSSAPQQYSHSPRLRLPPSAFSKAQRCVPSAPQGSEAPRRDHQAPDTCSTTLQTKAT